MRLVQFKERDGTRRLAIADGATLDVLEGTHSAYDLARHAIETGESLEHLAARLAGSRRADYEEVAAQGRLLPPVDHPEPARFWITGTGLTHIGSVDARDKMHATQHGDGEDLTDSMKIFRMGIEGGKPPPGRLGVQPEWFFKGVGSCVVPPEAPLPLPAFALAGGEEAEIVGLYIIDQAGRPRRIGFSLGNEFSDQVTEAMNYLYLAHSKLRACSLGPELLLGELPKRIEGRSRVIRDGGILWEGEFLSGEDHMSHSIRNLEHYHFRYAAHRRSGDLHAYFFGAAVLSCAAGVETRVGDAFEIDVPVFGRPLRNRMERETDPGIIEVRAL